MEIKYTLEILTKDIQDIENLVAKLQNSPGSPTLEIDLALSKLRNVYDVLSAIRTDMDELRQLRTDSPGADSPGDIPPVEKADSPGDNPPEPPAEMPPDRPSEVPPGQPEEVPVETPREKPAKPPREVPEKQDSVHAGNQKAGDTGATNAMKTRGKAEILAEQFLAGASINENLATAQHPDADTRVKGKPIDSISRNIGINDRFLIIRELFDGDEQSYRQLIDQLDQAGSAASAGSILGKRFEGKEEHEGIVILSGLVKRRFTGH